MLTEKRNGEHKMEEKSYQILGLERDASPDEIKRAYFRLIRKHSPEKDPEGFQEIRRAYEYLKDKEIQNDEKTIELRIPSNPLGRKMMLQIEECMATQNYSLAIRTAEEAITYFGEYSGYLYHLAIAQRMEGNTGKSVRNLEKLVKAYPDEPAFQRELALSAQERGYGKKACEAFERAYEMGVRDSEFILMFSVCCSERSIYKRGSEILEEFIVSNKNSPSADCYDLLEAYTNLFTMSMHISEEYYLRTIEEIRKFLLEFGTRLDDCEEDLFLLIITCSSSALLASDSLAETEGNTRFKMSVSAVRKASFKLLETARKLLPDLNGEWDELERKITVFIIQSSPETPLIFKLAAEAFLDIEAHPDADSQFFRFIQTDCKLCILEEWPENREELCLLRGRYPALYAALESFIDRLEHTSSIDRLRDIMLKDYDRLSQYFDGYYYSRYPQRRRGAGTPVWDSEMDGTFRRENRKVGRNDPCPCGSGKKYKHCCGRK